MNNQAIFVERRKHHRDGVMGELEDITYTVLRKYGATNESSLAPTVAEPLTQ